MPFHLPGRILWSQRRLIAWVLLLLIIACVWMFLKRDAIFSYFENLQQRNRTREEVRTLEERIRASEREKEALVKGGFQSEKVARETFRLSRQGEEILYLDPADPNDESPTSPTLLLTPEDSDASTTL